MVGESTIILLVKWAIILGVIATVPLVLWLTVMVASSGENKRIRIPGRRAKTD